VVFLNRTGFDFSLDRAPISPVAPAEAVAQAPSSTPAPAPTRASAPYQGHTLDILTDAPYSPLERFFLPELRAPYFYALPDQDNGNKPIFFGGLALAGQDRLGFHQYALLAQADSQLRDVSTLSFSYATALTAPWYTALSVARFVQPGQRDLQASLATSRTFWTTPVSFNLLALRRDYYATATSPGLRTTLLGPEAAISYFAGEGTSYGGTQRGVGLSLGAGVYPLAFDDANPFADLRAEATAYVPGLPLLLRDNLQFTAIARFLPNAPEGLLQVGGIQAGTALSFRDGPRSPRDLPDLLKPGTSFSEYLRGYEDYALSARSVLIAQARYRYRVIIDYGWTSFFWVLPSFFISQVELEAFGSWARTDLRHDHRAAGAALYVRTTFGQAAPVSLFYQYARRFDDGLGDLHLVGFAL
jgi:hypothetical protein